MNYEDSTRTDLQQAVKDPLVLISTMQQREERLRTIVNEQLQTLHGGVQRAGSDVNRVVELRCRASRNCPCRPCPPRWIPQCRNSNKRSSAPARRCRRPPGNTPRQQERLSLKASRGMFFATVALGLAALIAAGGGAYLLFHARQEAAACKRKSNTWTRSMPPTGSSAAKGVCAPAWRRTHSVTAKAGLTGVSSCGRLLVSREQKGRLHGLSYGIL